MIFRERGLPSWFENSVGALPGSLGKDCAFWRPAIYAGRNGESSGSESSDQACPILVRIRNIFGISEGEAGINRHWRDCCIAGSE